MINLLGPFIHMGIFGRIAHVLTHTMTKGNAFASG